jgi:hypothetical protein
MPSTHTSSSCYMHDFYPPAHSCLRALESSDTGPTAERQDPVNPHSRCVVTVVAGRSKLMDGICSLLIGCPTARTPITDIHATTHKCGLRSRTKDLVRVSAIPGGRLKAVRIKMHARSWPIVLGRYGHMKPFLGSSLICQDGI